MQWKQNEFDRETTTLSDDKTADQAEDSIDQPGEDPFFARMRAEENRRREFADGFSRSESEQPRLVDLLDDQRKQAAQLAKLDRSLSRMRRRVLIANLLSGTIVLTLLALSAYIYNHPPEGWNALNSAPRSGATHSGSDEEGGFPHRTDTMSDFAFASDAEFTIRTDVDRKYQLVIRELLQTAMTIRQPLQQMIEERNAATNTYIRFMADMSEVIEQAAEEQPSAEVMRALTNLVSLGQALRKASDPRDLDITTQNKLDQIKEVLRARDVRSRHPERR